MNDTDRPASDAEHTSPTEDSAPTTPMESVSNDESIALNPSSQETSPTPATPASGESTSAGRPTTLTQTRIDQLAFVVSQGNYMTTACKVLRIPYSTYQTWRKRGEEDLKNGLGPDESLPARLVVAIEEAAAGSEAALVSRWMEAGRVDWRADAELLARRFPERWAKPTERNGRSVGVGVRIGGGTTGEIVEVHMVLGGEQDLFMFEDMDQGTLEPEHPYDIDGEFAD